MNVLNQNGVDLLELWEREKTSVRAEVIAANISLSFTGQVVRHSTIELVLTRGYDEMSISLFCGSYEVFEPSIGKGASARYRRVVQITTDGGGQCTLYELCEPPPVSLETPSHAQPVDAPDPLPAGLRPPAKGR